MTLEEYRESFINDINTEALSTSRHPTEVFIDYAVDILKNDYSLISDMSQCYFSFTNGTKAYKNMHIDAAYLDLPSNTLNLLFSDYNDGPIKNITNDSINNKTYLLLNFFENALKKFFANAEASDPAVQLANDIIKNSTAIYKIHLFIVSTDKLSRAVKRLELPDYSYQNKTYKVDLDVLDFESIFRTKQADFQKEDVCINCSDFGVEGIPCIKAEIETDQYESYLAIVPGSFLADIYKKYDTTLLESNVRSFLKFNGGVNKGIRGTILNEKSRFFTYNNGISTTAKSITLLPSPKGLLITSFTDLQIINGGQTTATLAATNIRYNADLSGIYVQMKLTVIKENDPDLIRNIATYANSQNKVKTADLNSSHPFYVRMEDCSRRIYAPKGSGELVQKLWFFERARGQYEQPFMKMTKKQKDDYCLVRPKNMKFTLTDLAKYENASNMLPYYVSWGGEVNSAQFHNAMIAQWEKDNLVFNDLFYKELIGKKILFSYIEKTISEQDWYQEKRAYRPQLVAYTFSKLVYEAKAINKLINFRQIWDHQQVPEGFEYDVSKIAKLVFDTIYDENRSTANIETYCKKQECWNIISKKPYKLSETIIDLLVSKSELEVDKARAKKDQNFDSSITNEVSIFNKGAPYWESLLNRGTEQEVLNWSEQQLLETVIKYCNAVIIQLTKYQLKEVDRIVKKLKDNMIE